MSGNARDGFKRVNRKQIRCCASERVKKESYLPTDEWGLPRSFSFREEMKAPLAVVKRLSSNQRDGTDEADRP